MSADDPLPPEVVETHISTVMFAGDRAYKLLKPVKTGFLDHSSVASRLAAVDRKLELNRRLAPDVYLGAADLVENGEIADRLLIMRRLPHDRKLTALVDTPELEPALRTVARAVATLHAGLEPESQPWQMATADGLSRLWESSFEEIEPTVGTLIDESEFEEVVSLARSYLDHNSKLFERRREQGMIRDGHGDLTAEDIFVLEDGPRILDCLAFDDDLRVSDVLADIGFLVMDIHRLAGAEHARRLMRWYVEFSGEHHPSSLAHHYVAYRAHIRAKVEVIRHLQGLDPAPDSARSYHRLTLDHLRRARLRLVLVGGGPGVGKTSLAQALADRAGWLVLGSDELRKDIAGVPHAEHRAAQPWAGMYDVSTTEQTYDLLLRQAEAALEAGESVILDASWIAAEHRARARRAAARIGVDVVELSCSAPPDVAKARIADRRARGTDASDAGPEIVDEMAARQDPWPEAATVDTGGDLDESVAMAFEHVLPEVPASQVEEQPAP